jgi:hypothetical protein
MKSIIAGAIILALSGTVALADRDNFNHGGERVIQFGKPGAVRYEAFRAQDHSYVATRQRSFHRTQPFFHRASPSFHRTSPSFHRTLQFDPARGGRTGR